MDVKTAFLNGYLDEEVNMEQLEGFIVPGHENKVCKFVKSLYGLKQTPKQWDEIYVVVSNGIHLNEANKSIYSKVCNNHYVIICLYVHDMIIFNDNNTCIKDTKFFLPSHFDMKDLVIPYLVLKYIGMIMQMP